MQGFNMGRYVPPDLEGTTSGNKLHKKHALGQRASKLATQGILTVRFEMPFAIWCASCPRPTVIGQGVRFNAEKRRVGSYFTTPVWSFRFRHADCGGDIEMRTDPKNTAYVVVAGATRRDTGEGTAVRDGPVVLTDAEREVLRKSAFASLEKTIEDREQAKQATRRIDGLVDASARHWDDPYAQNQRLRRVFREGRKARESLAAATELLKDRMSLGMDLLPETEEDARRAALVEFGVQDDERDAALSKPLFAAVVPNKPPQQQHPQQRSSPAKKPLKFEKEASRRKEALFSELISNTRAAQDPFLQPQNTRSNNSTTATTDSSRLLLPGVKRKRAGVAVEVLPAEIPAQGPRLVHYDSD